MATIKVSDKELMEPHQIATFIKIFGRNKYVKTVQQFAKQRLLPETIAGMSMLELESLTQEQYEAKRDQIAKDMKLPDTDKPVYADVTIQEIALLGHAGQQLFLDTYGYERFMQAHELQGLEELNDKSFHQVLGRQYKPYTRTSSDATK